MVPAFAVALVVGLLGLIVVIFGGSIAENMGRAKRDPGRRIGRPGRMTIGGLVGFGMAGLSAEFSPLGLESAPVFGLALVGAVGAAIWAGYSDRRST